MFSSTRMRMPQYTRIAGMSLALLFFVSTSLFLNVQTTLARSAPHIGALSAYGHWTKWNAQAAPTDANCRVTDGIPCYSPQELRKAYNLSSLVSHGDTGKGQTIVIIDSFGSPTAYADLQKFDADYSLPDPPSFKQLSPIGSVPFNPTDQTQVGWAQETSLDIQWSHAMAPGANIVVLTSPVAETEGVTGMPEFLKLEQYAVHNHIGKIISQSWSATENTFFDAQGKQVIGQFEKFYQYAASQHVSVFASAGDSGSANVDLNNKNYPFPTVGYPASSPWVTAVGGTSLYADTSGTYQSETVWNDGPGSATGGGISQYFKEPLYQRLTLPKQTQQLLKGYRAIPDISMNADPSTAVPVYLGFLGAGGNGYYLFGGTSESAPCGQGSQLTPINTSDIHLVS